MRIILAPMQGVLDPLMRHLLCEINDYDLCVSEFVRVVEQKLPAKVFYRLAPELKTQGLTSSAVPVRVQLLGQSPHWLAENALQAIELGSQGIDLNCGCPSKTVNGSGGGAMLLKQPELIYQATKALREALPLNQPVSVKIRLGWEESSEADEIVDAVVQGGADEIAIHGRTKLDGYRADRINWQKIAEIKHRIPIPVIANGEVLDIDSANECLRVTSADGLMVARGALQRPNLGNMIKHRAEQLHWLKVCQLLVKYSMMDNQFDTGFYHVARIKQWLRYLDKVYPQALELFDEIKRCDSAELLKKQISQYVERISS